MGESEMQGLCTGVGFTEDKPHLEIRGEEKTLFPLQEEISFAIESKRSCIGYRPPQGKSLIACPGQLKDIGSSQCPDCFLKAKTLPCLRCVGDVCMNPARRDFCVQENNHALYLALFAPGLLKVGVARWERRRERVFEQGARAAIICAQDDGQIIRRVEHQIKQTGVLDRIPPTDKLKALTKRSSQEELLQELEDNLEILKPRIRANWIDKEVIDLPEYPLYKTAPSLWNPKEGKKLKGKFKDQIGQTIIVETDTNQIVALELPSLIGFELRSLRQEEAGDGQLLIFSA